MITKILLAVILYAFLMRPAYAYLDPGTGSFILQMLVAGILGAMFTIKMYWYRFKSWLAKLFGKEVDSSANLEESDNSKEAED